jgi:uncharacterized protein YaaR (DUF327 family)
MKKLLVMGVVFLFIGVAVAPSINQSVVKASSDNDLVEVTTQACSIQGYGNTSVKLTKQQYKDLLEYLVDFRARLNQTITREDALPIFKEAVVELNKYGLLPKGMSVEQAQRLVIRLYQNTKLVKCVKCVEKLLNTSEKSLLQEGNRVCLICGKAQSNTYFQGPVSKVIYDVLYILMNVFDKYSVTGSIAMLFCLLLLIHASMTIIFSNILRDLPYIGATIYYGGAEWGPGMKIHYYPAEGNIWTIGLIGIRNWNGQFYGKLSSLRLDGFFSQYYPGVNGFTGLRLYLISSDFYFGSALNVNVGS